MSDQKQTVQVKDKNTAAVFPLAAKPTKVIADPDTELLFEGTVSEEK